MENETSKAGSLNVNDLKSVLWNLAMVLGASATAWLLAILPQVQMSPVYLTIMTVTVYPLIKAANRYFADNSK